MFIPEKFRIHFICIAILSVWFIIGFLSLENDNSIQSYIAVSGLFVGIIAYGATEMGFKLNLSFFIISVSSYGNSLLLFKLNNMANHFYYLFISSMVFIGILFLIDYNLSSNYNNLVTLYIPYVFLFEGFKICGIISFIDITYINFIDISVYQIFPGLFFSFFGIIAFGLYINSFFDDQW